MKLKDIITGKINEVRMTPARVQKIQRNLQKAIEALKDNFPKYKAAKESGDEKKLKKHTKIALDLTKKKKELEKDLDKALGGLYADAELELEGKLTENTTDGPRYKKYVAKAFKALISATFEFRHAMGVKQLTNKDMKLKKEVDSIYKAIVDLQKEMKSRGLTEASIPKFSTPKEAFDYIMDLRSEAMEIEDQLRELSDVIIDTQRDMENDPEVTMVGSGASDKYGAVLNKYEEEHSMLRKAYNKVMAEIDEFDQRH